MDQAERTFLQDLFGNLTSEQFAVQLDSFVQVIGERSFCRKAATQLMQLTTPEIAIPGSLGRYIPLIRQGIEVFLAGISYRRLRKVLLSQFSLRDACEPAERLLNLALHFPTLHKLGQIIARNPQIDARVKRWLVGLEHGDYGTDPAVQLKFIEMQLAGMGADSAIEVSPHIIAEASVATVLPFSYRISHGDQTDRGVFKVLKPGIEEDLREELDVLATTFAVLEQGRELYGLQDMKLSSLFKEISGDLIREVDLSAEQEHLAQAARMYDQVAGVRVPRLVPFSTPIMTAMDFIDGLKLSDLALTPQKRKLLARQIFEAILCVPLFAGEQSALFHGDPHAGNILIAGGDVPDSHQVVLLDWTLAGKLSKIQRAQVLQLLLGIIRNDSRLLAHIVLSLAVQQESQAGRNPDQLAERIRILLASKGYTTGDPLRKAFRLLEAMTLEGVVFPSELILFRKSFFTLEGVLHDLCADFSMGAAMETYLGRLLLNELPQRCRNLMIPATDSSEKYRSLVSNRALQELSLHQALALWQQTMERNSSLFEAQLKLSIDFFMYLTGRRSME